MLKVFEIATAINAVLMLAAALDGQYMWACVAFVSGVLCAHQVDQLRKKESQ